MAESTLEADGPADGALQGKNSSENKLHISGNNNLTPSRVGRRIFTFPSVEGILFPYSASDITNMLSSIQMAFFLPCSACLPVCRELSSLPSDHGRGGRVFELDHLDAIYRGRREGGRGEAGPMKGLINVKQTEAV